MLMYVNELQVSERVDSALLSPVAILPPSCDAERFDAG